MYKIISYSLWGTDKKYCDGLAENIMLTREYYPDWAVRVYADSTSHEYLVELGHDLSSACDFELIIMSDSVGFRGLFWRMLPACDQSVDAMMCRDADSRHSEREQSAVLEWEASGKPFHCMRDHKAHGVPILGGMWGCVPVAMPWFAAEYDNWIKGMVTGSHRRGPYFDQDQQFLRHAIWPKVKDICIVHDDAGRYGGDVRPFPVPMTDNHFVGEIYD